MTRRRWVTIALIACFALSSPFMLRALANRLLFHPDKGQSRTPAAVGLAFEPLALPVDGYQVQAWWIAGQSGRPVLLMFHGNAGTMADRLDNVAELVRRFGVGMLMVEYPGYGDSGGTPSEASLYAAAGAGYAAARERAAGRKLVVFGRSLGGAVAIDTAARFEVDGLIAESTFTSLPAVASSIGFPAASWLTPYRFASLDKMPQIRCPLLLSHGDRDELIPYPMSEQLLAAAPAASKRLHKVEGGAHNGIWVSGGEAYWQSWEDYLSAL